MKYLYIGKKVDSHVVWAVRYTLAKKKVEWIRRIPSHGVAVKMAFGPLRIRQNRLELNQVNTCFTFQQVLYFATLWIGIILVHSTFFYQSVKKCHGYNDSLDRLDRGKHNHSGKMPPVPSKRTPIIQNNYLMIVHFYSFKMLQFYQMELTQGWNNKAPSWSIMIHLHHASLCTILVGCRTWKSRR